MKGQRLRQEVEVLALLERDPRPAEQAQRLIGADPFKSCRDRVDIDVRRLLALQPKQDRLVTAVAFPGGAQRSVQLNVNARDAIEQAIGLKPQCEQPRCAHRPDRVRTRRSDTNLEEVENADSHRGHPPPSRDGASLRPAPEPWQQDCIGTRARHDRESASPIRRHGHRLGRL